MSNFQKNYIGKGRQHKSLEIVTVTIALAEIEKFAHEYQGEKYLIFELAKLQNPDKFGKTHTAYVSLKNEEEPAEVPVPAPKPKRKRTK